MAISTRLALAAFLLGSVAPAGLWAQEAETPAESADSAAAAAPAEGTDAASDAAPAEGGDGAEGAAEGAAAGDDAAAPATLAAPAASADEAETGAFYIDSTQGDWTLRCQKTGTGHDPCEIYQLLKDGEGNSVAEVSMVPIKGEAAAGATLVAPLETDLVAGIGFKVDGAEGKAYPFSFCAVVGCVSRIGFTDAELSALKGGNKATVTLLPYGASGEQRVDLDLSLKGFTAGWDTLAKKNEAAAAAAPEASEAPAEEAPAAE